MRKEEAMTYRVVRLHSDYRHPDHGRVVRRGLTLEQAHDHCSREESRETGPDGLVWIDGFEPDEQSSFQLDASDLGVVTNALYQQVWAGVSDPGWNCDQEDYARARALLTRLDPESIDEIDQQQKGNSNG
jgi:hypothetical protein